MYTVYLILDPNFGYKVLNIAENHHVWLCDSVVNRLAASKFKSAERSKPWNEYGITLYEINTKNSIEEMFFDIIRTVDEHHNEYSHNPSWQKLVVIGVCSSASILSELNDISPGVVINTPTGFEFLKNH